jgi:predicted metalloprotease
MRWGDMRRSDNIEDAGSGGGGGGMLGGGMRLGGGATILIIIVSLIFGINPFELLGMAGGDSPVVQQQPTQQRTSGQSAVTDPQRDLVARVVGDTEDVWGALFQAMGSRYDPPKLTFFNGAVVSACGRATAAAGPFYCPADRRVYLDTAFFAELKNRFGAPGDFAQAYVIAHEVGHHVQNLMGTMREFDQSAARMDDRQRNAMSVRLELQADCYAGVWGFYAAKRNLLDPGDVEEGIRAASAVGDDTIQKRMQGHVVPDAFTHGTAAQRTQWFRTGLQSGDPRSCNTFAAKDL